MYSNQKGSNYWKLLKDAVPTVITALSIPIAIDFHKLYGPIRDLSNFESFTMTYCDKLLLLYITVPWIVKSKQ